MQFALGAWTFHHEVVSTGQDRMALQFWAVSLMFGAPAATVALRVLAERLGLPGGNGSASPGGSP